VGFRIRLALPSSCGCVSGHPMTENVSEQYYIDLWLGQEGKAPLLERVSQWLTQFCQDRQTRMQEANKLESFLRLL
jgi:hypothetical protein